MSRYILLGSLLVLVLVAPALASPIAGKSTEVVELGKYKLRNQMIYTVSDEMWNDDEERQDYVQDAPIKQGFEANEFEIRTGIYRGVMENLEIGIGLPFLFLKETPYLDAPEESGHGRGDLELTAKYNFIKDTVNSPAMSGLLGIKLPTGKEAKKGCTDLPTSSGGTDLIFMGILSKELDPLTACLNISYTITGKGKDEEGDEINPGNIFFYDLALDYGLNRRTTFVTELTGEFAGESKDNAKKKISQTNSSLTTILLGLQYDTVELKDVTVEIAFALRLAGKNEKTGMATILGFTRKF